MAASGYGIDVGIEEPPGELARQSRDVASRPRTASGALARPGSRAATAATYDVVTENLTGYQFVFTRRWILYIAFAVIFAVACGFLSNWQLDRGKQAVAYNALLHTNFSATPVPLDQALPSLTKFDGDRLWKRVKVTGTYDAAGQLFVRNRPLGSNTGFEVLTPLRLANGRTFIVDRGWVGARNSDTNYPASEPQPPHGTVTVVARLRAAEPQFGGITPIRNQIQTIDLTQVKSKVGGQLYLGAYGLLDYQTPAASTALKAVVTTAPTVDEGLHWSYMIQWIIFALVGFFALAYGVRTEFRRVNEDDPEEQEREAERVRKRARKAFTDAEIEDELLDGYIPLSRWGASSGARVVPSQPSIGSGDQPELKEIFAKDVTPK